jgi:hypothetical protein
MALGIGEGIAAAKLALDAGTRALDELRRPNIEPEKVRNHLITMQDHVLSAQRALGAAEDEIRDLKRQLDDRDELRALEADMDFVPDGAFYVRKSEREHGLLNALCPVCWGELRKAISMVPMASGYYQCVKHGSSYQTKEYSQELERQMRAKREPDPPRGPNSWMTR